MICTDVVLVPEDEVVIVLVDIIAVLGIVVVEADGNSAYAMFTFVTIISLLNILPKSIHFWKSLTGLRS